MVLNLPFIVLSLFPGHWREQKAAKSILRWLFYIPNAVGLLANCIDLVYFRFVLKRTTADIFSFISTGDDFTRLLPLFIKDYWYLFPIFILLLWLMVRYYRKTDPAKVSATVEERRVYFLRETTIFLLSMAMFTIIYRGGFQLKPIHIITAGQYTSARNIPLLINTPFSIMKTWGQESIKELEYFSEERLPAIYNTTHAADTGKFKQLNVVMLIMESFSKEYVGSLNNNQGYTPCLDSLIAKSLVFENAFANGKRSMEGIPACIAGIPCLMNEPYITSRYGSNKIRPIAALLKEKGYATSFYHAATNGSMGFDNFAKLAGFDKYVGRTEYNNEKDFDGHWGIWDEEFFQYYAGALQIHPQPFFSAFFSLTSHHPYPVPEKYKDKFREGDLPIEKSISYSDYSLGKFFETASKMSWFNNTLFIIVADHTGEAFAPFYSTNTGMFRIPVLFYLPGGELKGKRQDIFQQIDIMPTVLDYMNYDKPYFAFGKSRLDSGLTNYAYCYINNNYQIVSDQYALQFDGEKAIAFYNHKNDSLLQNNLIHTPDTTPVARLREQLKAVIQTYHHRLIRNQMDVR